jgi:hypothetical protein
MPAWRKRRKIRVGDQALKKALALRCSPLCQSPGAIARGFFAANSCWAILSNKADKDSNRTLVGRNNTLRQRLRLRQLRLLQLRHSMRDDALCG